MTKALNEMDGTELLAKYNSLSLTKRKAKFTSKAQAIKAIEKLSVPKVASANKAKKTEVKKSTLKTKGAVPGERKSLHGDAVIRTMVDDNPRRKGTDAHVHFEKMKGGPTVDKYLSKFEDKRKARQWLSNTIADGYVKLVGG